MNNNAADGPMVGIDSRWRRQTDLVPRYLLAWDRATSLLEAYRLIELGARPSLVSQLTGVEKCRLNRLFRDLHERPSPPGNSPFTDGWYLRSDRRMLHAAVIWRLYQQLPPPDAMTATKLLALDQAYRCLVTETLLDITHIAFVPRLVEIGVWEDRECPNCAERHPAPSETGAEVCAACRILNRIRCDQCGTPWAAGGRSGGRPRQCPACGVSRLR